MSAPLTIRYVTGLPDGKAALFDRGSCLLELRHGIDVEDLTAVLHDVALILAGDRPRHGRKVRHLSVI